MKSFAHVAAGVMAVLLSAGPAMAEAIQVPEPATMSLFGAGALAALAIRRFRGRK